MSEPAWGSRTRLRGALRAALGDTDDAALWSDTVLDQALDEAIAEHAHLFPAATVLWQSVEAGITEVQIFPSGDAGEGATVAQPASTGATDIPAPPPGTRDILSVQGVWLQGARLPDDGWAATGPAGTGPYAQGYAWRGNYLYFRNPLSSAEAGPGALRVALLQSYNLPSADDLLLWNGPALDLPLLLLLARRGAYQLLGEWQIRHQGLEQATFEVRHAESSGSTESGGAGTSSSLSRAWLHLAVPPILAALDTAIAAAVRARGRRLLRSARLE